MNKIRYLLSFSNIKPNAADKEKMASALLRGAENREKAFSRRRAVPVLRTVLIVLLVICAAAAAVFGIYKAAMNAPHAPDTAETEPVGPISDEGYTLITPMYQKDEIYGLFSDLMRCAGFLPPLVTVVDDGTLFSRFNCDEEDKKDVIMSLVAFAEPNEIDIGRRQTPRTLGEEKNIKITYPEDLQK